jgi:hypothetical protein
MMDDAAREMRAGVGHAADVDEERRQLVYAGGEFLNLALFGCVFEERGVVDAQHGGAGARRRDDVIQTGEGTHRLQGEVAGGIPIAGIVGGLTAAGLPFGHNDGATRRFEQMCRCEANRRAEQVYEAGDEEPDARRFGAFLRAALGASLSSILGFHRLGCFHR